MALSFNFHMELNSKYLKLRKASELINQYLKSKQTNVLNLLLKQLQVIGFSNDITIFDPTVHDTVKFFLNLYELMIRLEPDVMLSYWSCIDVLVNACKIPATRQLLTSSFQFLPILSRYLSDNLTIERRIQLLKLIQDLSNDIKITWQMPNLQNLIKTLNNLIVCQNNKDLARLALGILVNLCYNNLPVVYTLHNTVDVPKLLNKCSTLKGIAEEFYTCKLHVILELDKENEIFWKSIRATFRSIEAAFCENNVPLLRQIIIFFFEMQSRQIKDEKLNEIVTDNFYYNKQISSLLYLLEDESINNNEKDPECVALIFEFLQPLVEMNLTAFKQQLEFLIKYTMKYLQNEIVSPYALQILTVIVGNAEGGGEEEYLEALTNNFPIFIMDIKSIENNNNLMSGQKIIGLVQLFKAMLHVNIMQKKILSDLDVNDLCQVFKSLLGSNNGTLTRASRSHSATIYAVTLYVHTLDLINELVKYCPDKWEKCQRDLFSNRRIHMVLAQALLYGTQLIKIIILKMSKLEYFPQEHVSQMMATLQAPLVPEVDPPSGLNELGTPLISLEQMRQIDDVLSIIKKAMKADEIRKFNNQTYDVIELYEYKLSTLKESEKRALATIEVYSERCTQLQLRIAELTSEVTRYHQLLLHNEESKLQTNRNLLLLKEEIDNTIENISEVTKCVKENEKFILPNEHNLLEAKFQLFTKCREINILIEQTKAIENKYNELKDYVTKYDENSEQLDEALKAKDNLLRIDQKEIKTLNKKKSELEEQIKHTEIKLRNQNGSSTELNLESKTKQQAIDVIMKVANVKIPKEKQTKVKEVS